jgi:peptidoglycan/xylan/chitin deacetylase (PgdA/CDA1 family)
VSERRGVKRTLVALPAKLGLTGLWRWLRPGVTPVIAFHGVLPERESHFFNATGKFVTPERLRAVLKRFCRLYQPTSIEDLVGALLDGRELKNRFVLTFDDGYANVYNEAFPLLRDMGIPFTVFVTTGMVDTDRVMWNDLLEFAVFSTEKTVLPAGVVERPLSLRSPSLRRDAIIHIKRSLKLRNLEDCLEEVENICRVLKVRTDAPELAWVRFLTRDQIREMSQAGVILGGHTVNHPILSREPRQRVREEVGGCKHDLEEIAGRSVITFAYPSGLPGEFDDTAKEEVQRAGYRAAFTAIPKPACPGDDLFAIGRLLVDCRWTHYEIETKASGMLRPLRR